MLQQWMITVGILFAYVAAWIIYKSMPDRAAALDWRLILAPGAVPAIVGFVLRTRMPESPQWLIPRAATWKPDCLWRNSVWTCRPSRSSEPAPSSCPMRTAVDDPVALLDPRVYAER